EDYWNNLLAGVSGAAPITRFDASKFKTRFACEVKGFNPEDHFDRKEARKLDTYTWYGLVSSTQAIKDSGLDAEGIDRNEIGVIWGSGIGGLDTFQTETFAFAKGDGTPRFNPFFIPKMIADICSGHISMKFGLRGPNFTTVSACASSTNALIDAFNYIRMGKANAIVTGGSEAAINESGVGGFNAAQAMSTRNDDPASASRPYDKDRDGFVLGEGSGAIVLEELEHALKRGAKIYAEIIGGGMSADAYHITAPHPEGLGANLVMQRALKDANIGPDAVDYINTHGTSTPLGDTAELKAIREVFGDNAFKLNISSSKSMTGHLLGAAGSIEAIATILAVKNNVVPPTINLTNLDPQIDANFKLTPNKKVEREVRAAISNTFGFGGHNAAIVVSKYNG
ncbi:MAG: beta-ketoacyl-ACP synthase II, partial [Bacteroidia bacterium]